MQLHDVAELFSHWSREAFQLPPSPHADDAIPQCGFFAKDRSRVVALVGINPGGNSGEPRSTSDAASLPAWEAFSKVPTLENFAAAQTVHLRQLRKTRYWAYNVAPVLRALRLSEDAVALFNCMPFRTKDTKWSAETKRAAARHTRQVLTALGCPRVVAMGKLAAEVLVLAGASPAYTLNRGRGKRCCSERGATLCMMTNEAKRPQRS